MTEPPRPQVTFSADDFGLSLAVNEAVEIAHRTGVLDAASLMVAGPAAADAVRRARAMPRLQVGLHLVVIEGRAVLPPAAIPALVDADGWFDSHQWRRGIDYFFRPAVRRQLRAEIAAQFAAYAATGLPLHHADAHKHMHLHPTVGQLLIDQGRACGLPRLRVPAEPPRVLVKCGERPGLASRALYRWSGLLRRQAMRAGLSVDDHVFGLHWSGHVTADRLLCLAPLLPTGTSEIYLHPATARDPLLARLIPHYDPIGELAALCDPQIADAYRELRRQTS